MSYCLSRSLSSQGRLAKRPELLAGLSGLMQSPSHAAWHMVSEQNVASCFSITRFPSAHPAHQPARRLMFQKQTMLGQTSMLLPAGLPLPGAQPLPFQEATQMRPPPSTHLSHPTPPDRGGLSPPSCPQCRDHAPLTPLCKP